jgi:tetratricopeptide (TPR) repeat protein
MAREDLGEPAPLTGPDGSAPERIVARRAEAQALHGLGETHRLAGRLEQARGHLTRALALREEIGYRRGAALTRLCLADTDLAADRPDDALPHLTRARAALLAENDPYEAARALALIGRATAHGGAASQETAEAQLLQALAEFEETGSVHWQARVLEWLGVGAEERGDLGRARYWYEQSLARYTAVSAPDGHRLGDRLRRLP